MLKFQNLHGHSHKHPHPRTLHNLTTDKSVYTWFLHIFSMHTVIHLLTHVIGFAPILLGVTFLSHNHNHSHGGVTHSSPTLTELIGASVLINIILHIALVISIVIYEKVKQQNQSLSNFKPLKYRKKGL